MFKVNIHKTFSTKRREVVIRCDANIQLHKTTALYGQSGVGKSTILRMIAGLEVPDGGEIIFGNEILFSSEKNINKPIKDRPIGFVFQDFNLFPNMSVKKNLEYASENSVISDDIHQLLDGTSLLELLNSYPNELSGGQRQRISIIRALCQKPEILLLDEPFSALDDEAILELIKEIEFIQSKLNMTIIVISHRKDVIFKMAEQVVHLTSDGMTIEGKPKDILELSF